MDTLAVEGVIMMVLEVTITELNIGKAHNMLLLLSWAPSRLRVVPRFIVMLVTKTLLMKNLHNT